MSPVDPKAGKARQKWSPRDPATPGADTDAVPALRVHGLCKEFRARGERPGDGTVAASDVSFAVPAGGALGIVGESGSGKSTIARMLVGLLAPDRGTVEVDGRERSFRSHVGRAQRLARAREVQMVFQDPYVSLDPRLSAEQCVGSVLRLHGLGDRAARARRTAELLDQVGLGSREAAARPHALSGGQRQRLSIARALAAGPRVLVLDEAVSALDVSIQAQIVRLLADLRRDSDVALVFVTHDLAVVQHVTDDLLVLYRGVAVEQGRTAEVLAAPRHAYTQLLVGSVPRPGWDPAEVVRLRAAVLGATV
ncbi:ABC transporter ATP-binding protein [Streptodolium elevatio]